MHLTICMSDLRTRGGEKRLSYNTVGSFIIPLIFLAGGLRAVESAKHYKELQKLIGPSADWLDTSIGLTLTKTRAHAATCFLDLSVDVFRGRF